MEIVSREDIINGLVRCNSVMDEDTLYEIEAALGFELTPSQISFIITGEMRFTGRTTAEAIRQYLSCVRRDCSMVYVPHTEREYNEDRHKIGIVQKLMDSGLPKVDVKLFRR